MLFNRSIIGQTAIPVVTKGLDAYTLRGRAQANNISNVTTEGYKRIEVNFEEQLKSALDTKKINGDRTDVNHMFLGRSELENIHAEGYRVEDMTTPGEINNVDIDIEMAKLAENQIQFEFGVKFIKGRMEDITSAIRTSRG